MKYLLATVLLTTTLSAQIVRVANHATVPFSGWKRTTIDVMPPHPVGMVGNTLYVVGRSVGSDVHVLDIRVALQPGQAAVFDLSQANAAAWTRGPFPTDVVTAFGGIASVAGHVMQPVNWRPDGAGYTFQLRARPQTLLCVDLWCTWYPDQPGFCLGEVAMTASNPTIPDLAVQPSTLPIGFGDATVLPLGGTPGNLLPQGSHFADGQARILPVAFVWPRHLHTLADWQGAIAASQYGVGAVGIRNLHIDGNPIYPSTFSVQQWMGAHWAPAVAALHTWEPAVCGPARISSVSGQQEDQTFVRGEALLPGGTGAELIAYLSALKLAARPCHHLEGDGRPLDLAQHVTPRLVFWEGRAHWSTVVSPDQLGKPASPSLLETKMWWGPDVEHWLMNTLAAATRLTGSPACQWLLAHQARIYLLQCTTEPGLSTSNMFAARSVGWEGILAVHLWRELEDRNLAALVRTRWQDRVTNVIVPQYGNRPQGVWDARFCDPRLGKGWWYHPWQQAVGAYGLDLGCTVLGPASGRQVALDAALVVLRDAFVLEQGTWHNFAAVALDGRVNPESIFYLFGSPLAAAVVLRHQPNHATARSIWQQMRSDATTPEQFSWFAPGVQ